MKESNERFIAVALTFFVLGYTQKHSTKGELLSMSTLTLLVRYEVRFPTSTPIEVYHHSAHRAAREKITF
jgi:hypothetical protein